MNSVADETLAGRCATRNPDGTATQGNYRDFLINIRIQKNPLRAGFFITNA